MIMIMLLYTLCLADPPELRHHHLKTYDQPPNICMPPLSETLGTIFKTKLQNVCNSEILATTIAMV